MASIQPVSFKSDSNLLKRAAAVQSSPPKQEPSQIPVSSSDAKPSPKNSQKLATIFEKMGTPYVLGRIWTTDSMIRETTGLVSKRKAEGCIAVEMEVAGVQSVCDFYGLELYDFLEAGDVLEASGYEVEGLHGANHNLGKLYIALEIAIQV